MPLLKTRASETAPSDRADLGEASRRARGPTEPRVVLGAIIVAHWIALVVFALTVQRNGWLFYQGGDQTFFYTDSWVVAHGHIPESKVGYAWVLLLAPLAALLGPSFLTAVPVIVLLQTLVLGPIAILAIYGVGARIGGRVVGYLAAFLWVALPYVSIPLFIDRYHEKYVEQFLPQALGLTGLGDYPSTVCLLVAAYFLVRALDVGDLSNALLAGTAAGFAVGIKPANALFLAGPALAIVGARRWRSGAAFAAATVPPLLALVLWKARGLGYVPLLTPDAEALAAGSFGGAPSPPLAVVVSRYLDLDWDRLHDNFLYLREVFWSVRIVQWLPIAGVIAVARLSIAKALFLGGWLGAFLLVKGSSTEASLEAGTLLRLIMPALPPFVLLAAAIPLLVPVRGPSLARRFAVPARPGNRLVPAVSAVAAFGILPLAILALLPPVSDARAATLSQASVYIPVENGFRLRAVKNARGGIELGWPERDASTAEVFYSVYRSPASFKVEKGSPDNFPTAREGVLCERKRGGANRCSFEMEQVATTRTPRWSESPSPGVWTYRVGVTANWENDERFGDTLVMSAPLTIRVP